MIKRIIRPEVQIRELEIKKRGHGSGHALGRNGFGSLTGLTMTEFSAFKTGGNKWEAAYKKLFLSAETGLLRRG